MSRGASRAKITTLGVLGGLIAGILAYRRRAFNRYADEFHSRYG